MSHQLPKFEVYNLDPYSTATDADRCSVSTVEPERLLRFPTILSDSSCFKQDITGTSSSSDLNNTMLANPAVVPQRFEFASKCYKSSKAISVLIMEIQPLSTEQHSYAGGLEGFREKLSHTGISEEKAKLVTRSRRTSTLANYEST